MRVIFGIANSKLLGTIIRINNRNLPAQCFQWVHRIQRFLRFNAPTTRRAPEGSHNFRNSAWLQNRRGEQKRKPQPDVEVVGCDTRHTSRDAVTHTGECALLSPQLLERLAQLPGEGVLIEIPEPVPSMA